MEKDLLSYEFNFKDYTKLLFSVPVESKDLQDNFKDARKNFSTDKEFCDFLFNVFNEGYSVLFKENFLETSVVNYENFEIIRKYIQAMGADIKMTGFDFEKPYNKLEDIQISFDLSYGSGSS